MRRPRRFRRLGGSKKARTLASCPRCLKNTKIVACVVGMILLWPVQADGRSHSRHAARHIQSDQYVISFKEQLGLTSDITLSTDSTSASLTFYCESGWKPSPGSQLHLIIEHSPDLDGNRSFLSVSLNYGILRSLRLDPQNQRQTEVIIQLPSEQLKLDNELVFSVEQYPAAGASKAGLRTVIQNESYILIQTERNEQNLDLALLPSPIIDPYSYRPRKMSVLLPAQMSLETLEATALLVANFCARASQKPVEIEPVRSVEGAEAPLLIVGTPVEQPYLRGLQPRLPFVIHGGPVNAQIRMKNGGMLTGSEGVVGLLITKSEANSLPVMLVTAGSPVGVLTAARNLLNPELRFNGKFARISADYTPSAKKSREWKGFLPPSIRFKLSDLGYTNLKIGPQNDFSLAVSLNATPDTRFLGYGHEVNLFFRLNPEAGDPDTEVSVLWNNALVKKALLREIVTGSVASISAKLPADLLKTSNLLRIVWRGSLHGASKGPAAWLLAQSEFYLPRIYAAELPDLALLQFHLYPFSLSADLSDTILLLPNQPSLALLPAVLELSSILGRLAPSEHLAFRVRRHADLTERDKDRFHFISLNIENTEDSPERIFPGWKPLPRMRSMKGAPSVREAFSPWHPRRYVLSISDSSASALRGAIRQVFQESNLKQLRGDAALLGSEIVSLRATRRERVQEASPLTQVEAWLRVNWLALPLILTAVSGLLFLALRLMLSYYRKGR